MEIYINHCGCHDSNWGGDFSCSVIVTIKRVPKGKRYYDEPEQDWKNLIYVIDESCYKPNKGQIPYSRFVQRLDQKILDWLALNVKDGENSSKQWCVGTDDYNSKDVDFCVFFCRISDAVKFVKTWSIYKKPTSYFNYFTEDRRELNMETGKLQKV
jgi:hypothetical protein